MAFGGQCIETLQLHRGKKIIDCDSKYVFKKTKQIFFDKLLVLSSVPVILQIQLSLSSRAIHGGAYFSDVSGWNSILISVPGPCEVTEWHRLLGFCLMITFCLNPAQQAVSLWNCRVCWRICLFYLYGFVTNGKYLWSPRREILQFQWQFQLETACCAKVEQKVVVR